MRYAELAMSTPARALVTEAEFLALPESNQYIELIDGEIVVPSSPTFRHQVVLGKIVFALTQWAHAQSLPATVAQAVLDVRFGPGRILQPDAMVFLEQLPLDTATPIDRIPALCLEVLSTDRVYDRVTKRSVYAEAGVREYWLVDAGSKVVEQRSGSGLTDVEWREDTLASPLLPGFVLDLKRVFAG
jgi:Uma2 family endonuclease